MSQALCCIQCIQATMQGARHALVPDVALLLYSDTAEALCRIHRRTAWHHCRRHWVPLLSVRTGREALTTFVMVPRN